jgi:hypothetical protein
VRWSDAAKSSPLGKVSAAEPGIVEHLVLKVSPHELRAVEEGAGEVFVRQVPSRQVKSCEVRS